MNNTVFPEFPYEKRFTRNEIQEITEESEKLADAMRDGVAPNGAVMYLDESLLRMWCVHGVLAGVRVDPDLAHIVAVKIPDTTGQFADSVEWVLRGDLPSDYDEAQAEAEAQKLAKAMRERMPEKVRKRTAELLAAGFDAANPANNESED